MKTGTPPINEIVNLVDAYAPHVVLEELRTEFPQLHDQLFPGMVAGPAKSPTRATAEVALRLLRWNVPLCDSGVMAASNRIKNARICRLVGGLSAAVGGGSAIASLPASQPIIAAVGGGVSLAGALTSVFVDFLERLDGQQASLFEVYGKLVQLRLESLQLENQIQMLLGLPQEDLDESTLADAIGEANRVCKDINVECAKLNISAIRAQLQSSSIVANRGAI